MPQVDVTQLVHAAVERNREIPAILDAYSEFLDSPIGPLELQNLTEVFGCILDNLAQRFPDIASRRAAKAAQTDVTAFLAAAGNEVDILKSVMKVELTAIAGSMVNSISERFRKMSSEERQAVDSTLRIIRRSKVELLFKADAGKHLVTDDPDFKRFFAIIKSQAPEIRELRYQNLIVEKAIYNKLILKSKGQDFFIWVPSFYAKEAGDQLIERNGVISGHSVHSLLNDLNSQGEIQSIEPFLKDIEQNLGIANHEIPQPLEGLFKTVNEYKILPPIDLDDVSTYFAEKRSKLEAEQNEAEERKRVALQATQKDQEMKSQLLREKMRPQEFQVTKRPSSAEQENSIYLGKAVDFNQFVEAINRRITEKEIVTQVKQLGDYFLEPGENTDLSIVGASGSGKSITLNRILDGISSKSRTRVLVIDQKGEHRGIAWKFKWPVFALVKDSQAEILTMHLMVNSEHGQKLVANLIQEWLIQSGYSCTDVQKERISSLIAAQSGKDLDLSQIVSLIQSETELSELGQRLKKNLVQKGTLSKIFSTKVSFASSIGQNLLFDISGRGLKDPTTKEERSMLAALLLREFIDCEVSNSTIVVEDVLDRFRVPSLRGRVIEMIQELKNRGNRLIITSKSVCREFLGHDRIELVHRLSGEKTITDEFSQFYTNVPTYQLTRIIGFIPRGYLITSKWGERETEAVLVDRLEYGS